jgi:hypothetical protein
MMQYGSKVLQEQNLFANFNRSSLTSIIFTTLNHQFKDISADRLDHAIVFRVHTIISYIHMPGVKFQAPYPS